MSTEPDTPDAADSTDEEERLFSLAQRDLKSAVYARTVLKEKYDYSEEELP